MRLFQLRSEVEFIRDFVGMSQPVVLTDLSEEDWPCLAKWSVDHLLSAAGRSEVSVNVTSNGRADSVDSEGRFVQPLEEQMLFEKFLQHLQKRDTGDVLYLSRQNDSLREEFPGLLPDVPAAIPLARQAFGNEPEAVNLWIGDERSVSSCHKDPYENLYLVVRGEKLFTLMPPASAPFLHEQLCSPASLVRQPDGKLQPILDDAPPVPWIPFDVAGEVDAAKFPLYARFRQHLAVEVAVGPGELLYLPAMWYHRVAQRGITIAVNYWHDMQIGHGYVHHQLIRDLFGLDVEASDSEGWAAGEMSSPDYLPEALLRLDFMPGSVISTYAVRGKEKKGTGRFQLFEDAKKRGYGGRSAGAKLRRHNAKRFFEKINSKFDEWGLELRRLWKEDPEAEAPWKNQDDSGHFHNTVPNVGKQRDPTAAETTVEITGQGAVRGKAVTDGLPSVSASMKKEQSVTPSAEPDPSFNLLPSLSSKESEAEVLNDLEAAIEVQSGDTWKVLYPGRSLTVRGDESVKVRLREVPQISGTCSVSGAALHAARSFGEKFGSDAKQWMQKERREALLESSQRRRRQEQLEAVMAQMQTSGGRSSLRGRFAMYIAIAIPILVALMLVCAVLQPADSRQGVLISAVAVILLLGINTGNARLWLIAEGASAPIHAVFKYSHSCKEPRLRVCILVSWCIAALSLLVTTINHLTLGLWQGLHLFLAWEILSRYESAFEKLVANSDLGAATVFLPECAASYGKHSTIPRSEQLDGECWCIPLYGTRKSWGCKWWTAWTANVEKATRQGAELQVVFWKNRCGQGKVRSFATVGAENLRRDALEALAAGLEGLSKDLGEDGTSQYSREADRLFLASLSGEDRGFLQASEGLGISQKAEVAWLERKGYQYTEREDTKLWIKVPAPFSEAEPSLEALQKTAEFLCSGEVATVEPHAAPEMGEKRDV
ncbi:Jmjd7 [Symbiodinium microadriaticum]|nr:Jmjd7 [Symbiodinium microadriaticum]